MAFNLQSLADFITPPTPLSSMPSLGNTVKDIMARQEREAALAAEMAQRRRDNDTAQHGKAVEFIMEEARARAAAEKDRTAQAVKQQELQTAVLAGLPAMMAQSPDIVRPTLAANNMLGSRERGGLGEDTLSVLDQIGVPGNDPLGVIAGGQRFDLSEQGIKQRAEDDVVGLFEKNIGTVSSEDVGLANSIVSMAPESVRTANGDKEKAAEMLFKRYNDAKAQLQRDMKRRGIGKGKGDGLSPSLYIRFSNDARTTLAKHGFYEANERLAKMAQAYTDIGSENGTRNWNGIRALLAMQGEGAKPSDFDVKRAPGLTDTWTQVESWVADKVEGTLSDAQKKQIRTALLYGMKQRHEEQKRAYTAARNTASQGRFAEQIAAYADVIDGSFNTGLYDWYKSDRPTAEPAQATTSRPSSNEDARDTLNTLLEEAEKESKGK